MIDRVEKLTNVDLYDPATPHPDRCGPEIIEGFACGASRSEAVREVVERLLVHRLEHHRYRPLQHLILEGGDTDGTRLHPIPLRDMHPPNRRGSVSTRLRAVEERLQV